MTIPKWVMIPSLIISLISVIPIFYLVLRSLEADQGTWDWIIRHNTLYVIGRSLGLTFSVTLISIFISVPIGWLTTSTNIPMKKFWTVVNVLQLVIPSYIGAYIFN